MDMPKFGVNRVLVIALVAATCVGSPNASAQGAPTESDIVSVEPARLLDTRTNGTTVDGSFGGIGSIGPDEPERVMIAGRHDIPSDATGIEVNLTVINPGANGYATLYPCDSEPPNASTLNFAAGTNIANASLVALSAGGAVCIYSSTSAHFALDVLAYTPVSSLIGLLEPARLVDTRTNGMTADGRYSGGGSTTALTTLEVEVAGRAGVPIGAAGVEINLIAVQPTATGYATLYPCNSEPPTAAALNYSAGTNIGNATLIALSPNGTICIATSAATHLVLDVMAFIPPASDVTLLTPARLVDTRSNGQTVDNRNSGTGPIGRTYTFGFSDRGGIPPKQFNGVQVTALELNLTVVNPAGKGFATLFPCSYDDPTTATINFEAGDTVANAATVQVRPFGSVCLSTSTEADFVVDLVGYVTAKGNGSPVWYRPSNDSGPTTYMHSQDGTRAAFFEFGYNRSTDSFRGDLSVLDTSTGSAVATLNDTGYIEPVRLSPGATEVLFLSEDGLRLWNVKSDVVIALGDDPCSHQFSAAWTGLVSFAYRAPLDFGSVRLCNLDGGRAVDISDDWGLSRNGRYLANGTGGQITVTDLSNGGGATTSVSLDLWQLAGDGTGSVSDSGDVLIRRSEPEMLGILPAGASSLNDVDVLASNPPSAPSHFAAAISADGSTMYSATWVGLDGDFDYTVLVEAFDGAGRAEVGSFHYGALFDYPGDDECLGHLETAGNSFLLGNYDCV